MIEEKKDDTWLKEIKRRYFLPLVASCSLGGAQAAIEAARDHLAVRKQFNTLLKDFQVSSHNLFHYKFILHS